MADDTRKKYPLRWRDAKKGTGQTNERLLMDEVPDGWLWCVQNVAVVDKTTAFTHLYIGFWKDPLFEVVEHTPSPAAATWYTWAGELYLWPEEIFAAELNGTTNLDLLEWVVRGWRQRIK